MTSSIKSSSAAADFHPLSITVEPAITPASLVLEEMSPQASIIAQDQIFLSEIRDHTYMKLLHFKMGEPVFNGERDAVLASVNKINKYTDIINNASCVKHPRYPQVRLAATITCGVAYLFFVAFAPDKSSSNAKLFEGLQITSAAATVGGVVLPAYENYKKDQAKDKLLAEVTVYNNLLESQRTKIARVGVALVREWVASTPCYGQPKLFTKLVAKGAIRNHFRKEAQKAFILNSNNQFLKNQVKELRGAYAQILRSSEDVEYVIEPILQATGVVQLDSVKKEIDEETAQEHEIETLTNNTFLATLMFARKRQENAFREMLETNLYAQPTAAGRIRRTSKVERKGDASDQKATSAPAKRAPSPVQTNGAGRAAVASSPASALAKRPPSPASANNNGAGSRSTASSQPSAPAKRGSSFLSANGAGPAVGRASLAPIKATRLTSVVPLPANNS